MPVQLVPIPNVEHLFYAIIVAVVLVTLGYFFGALSGFGRRQ